MSEERLRLQLEYEEMLSGKRENMVTFRIG